MLKTFQYTEKMLEKLKAQEANIFTQMACFTEEDNNFSEDQKENLIESMKGRLQPNAAVLKDVVVTNLLRLTNFNIHLDEESKLMIIDIRPNLTL